MSELEEIKGEIIGSSHEYDVFNNPKNLTLIIDDPIMETPQTRLYSQRFGDEEIFVCQDLSTPEKIDKFAQSGTWVQIPEQEVDLFTHDYIDREFSVLNCKYKFKLRKLAATVNELEVWLMKRDLLYAYGLLKIIGVNKFEDLYKIKDEDFSKLTLTEKQKNHILDQI